MEGRNVGVLGEFEVYTDGSKTSEGTGSGIFIEELDIRQSLNLNRDCSVFQAELLAIRQACKLLSSKDIEDRDITIYIDSQAAIKALSSKETKSVLVKSCKEAVQEVSRTNNIRLCWIPGHEDHRGNEEADLLARNGSAAVGTLSTVLGSTVLPPLCAIKREIDIKMKARWELNWQNTQTCKATKLFFPQTQPKLTKVLLGLNKQVLRLSTGIITGHCFLGKMAKRMKKRDTDECRYCKDLQCVEDVEHILCECPALARKRFSMLGEHYLSRENLQTINFKDVLKFVKSTKCLEQNET